MLFYGTKFFSKNRPKIRNIFENFHKKISVLRFKMVSNGKILKNIDEITHKTPHRPFLENRLKILKIFENLTPKTPQNSLFIASLGKKFWPNVLFYG